MGLFKKNPFHNEENGGEGPLHLHQICRGRLSWSSEGTRPESQKPQ